MVAIVPLIYYHGSDSPHEVDEHPLYQIFEEPNYRELVKSLNKKNSNRVLLSGQFEGVLPHFVTHYANRLTENGKQVIVKEIV